MYPLHVLIGFHLSTSSFLYSKFSLLYLGCFNAVASVYNVLRGFNRSSTLSLAFSFPSSEGVFISVVVDMNEVYCFNAGHTKLNTQAISK